MTATMTTASSAVASSATLVPQPFSALAERLGVDPGTRVDPRQALIYAAALRCCRTCTAQDRCRFVLGQNAVTLRAVEAFCPLRNPEF